MAYNPTVWEENDLLSADRMNKIENGIAEAYTAADEQHQALTEQIAETKNELQADIQQAKAESTVYTDGKVAQAQVSLMSEMDTRNAAVSATISQIQAELSHKISSEGIEEATVLTQAEYDALTTKNETTLYLVKEEA